MGTSYDKHFKHLICLGTEELNNGNVWYGRMKQKQTNLVEEKLVKLKRSMLTNQSQLVYSSVDQSIHLNQCIPKCISE